MAVTGRQLKFYAHPDDYGDLSAGLDALRAVSIDDRSPTKDPIVRDIATLESIWQLVTQKDCLASLSPRYSEHQQCWIYSVSDDVVIELHQGKPREGILRPGRVYYTPQALIGDEVNLHLENKPQNFIVFAELLRRWIRSWCKKREDLLLAPSLAARFDRGELARKGIQGELELLR
jgi:hypothetical protein